MQNDPIYKKSRAVVSRPLKPETLILPLKAGSVNLNQVYLLNETAGRIWELLDGQRSVSTIVGLITQEFEVTSAEVAADFAKLVSELQQLNILEEVAN